MALSDPVARRGALALVADGVLTAMTQGSTLAPVSSLNLIYRAMILRARADPVPAFRIGPKQKEDSMVLRLVTTLLLLALPAAALAQQRTQPAPVPDRTSTVHGDWTLRCETARQPASRLCEIALTFTDARNQPLAQMVLGRIARGEPMRIILQVPLEVRVDEPVRLQPDPAAAGALTLAFRMCSVARGGCFAEAELPNNAALRGLRARGDEPGRVTFRDSAGREVRMPMSLRGFGAALDALAREMG